jgi:hypothetical protein
MATHGYKKNAWQSQPWIAHLTNPKTARQETQANNKLLAVNHTHRNRTTPSEKQTVVVMVAASASNERPSTGTAYHHIQTTKQMRHDEVGIIPH